MNWEDIDPEKMAEEILKEPTRAWSNRTLTELGALVPEKDDPSVLFRRNWLGRGQAFGLVASSGVGKSSMADQMAFHWAVGEGFLAEPTRKLKIAIIQAEDSDRDLQEQRDGMIKGLASEGWSAAKIEQAIRAVTFPTDFIGIHGDEFVGRLADYQHDNACDLIFINPLQRFFGGDVSSQKDTSHFCAELDKILKSPDTPCAMGIVMHTPKFHSGVRDGRQSVDDFAEYAMAGSQEWTAWVRAVINFQKHGTSEEYFDVKASKRGKRIGWKDANGNDITKRIFKHSDGFIYWQEVVDPDEIASIPDQIVKTPKKRESKPEMDLGAATSFWANEIIRCPDLQEMGTAKLREAIYDAVKKEGRTRLDARNIFDNLVDDPTAYGLQIVSDKNGKKTLKPDDENDVYL